MKEKFMVVYIFLIISLLLINSVLIIFYNNKLLGNYQWIIIIFVNLLIVAINYKLFIIPNKFIKKINNKEISPSIKILNDEINKGSINFIKKSKYYYLLALFFNAKGDIKKSMNYVKNNKDYKDNNIYTKCFFEIYILNLIMSKQESKITLEEEKLMDKYKQYLFKAIIMARKKKYKKAKINFDEYISSEEKPGNYFLEKIFRDPFFKVVDDNLDISKLIKNYLLGDYYYEMGNNKKSAAYFKKVLDLGYINSLYHKNAKQILELIH